MAGYASDRCIRRPRAEGRASTRSRTVQSRCIDTLAADAPAALAAIASARAARARTWTFAGDRAPDHDPDATAPLVIDVDATLVTAHSEKESAAPTFKRGFGFHPLWAFVDHAPAGTGEPPAFGLRAGNAGSNTVTDHIAVLRAALASAARPRPRSSAGHERADPHRRRRRHP
jgi:Transposase DDE domain group 1